MDEQVRGCSAGHAEDYQRLSQCRPQVDNSLATRERNSPNSSSVEDFPTNKTINNPPVITILIVGIQTVPSHGWFIVLPCFTHILIGVHPTRVPVLQMKRSNRGSMGERFTIEYLENHG